MPSTFPLQLEMRIIYNSIGLREWLWKPLFGPTRGKQMHYEGTLFRPPSEAQSMLIQVTTGCSYNKCTYCAMYMGTEFRLKPMEEIKSDIKEGAGYRFKRVFLCDGDALAAPTAFLEEILDEIREGMPFVERVGVYGEARSILKKGPDALKRLKEKGLGIVYHGVESGDDETLKAVKKGATAAQTVKAAQMVKNAGLLYSCIVMLGLGGKTRHLQHAQKTAELLNAIQPDYIGVLTTMLVEGTPLFDQARRGEFELPSRLGMLEELKIILETLQLKRGLLTSRHSSNYLPMRVVFPYQQGEALKMLREVLEKKDETILKPDFLRQL